MISLLDKPFSALTEEKIVVLPNISWAQFKAIEAQLENNTGVKLSYLSGVMEIMAPISDRHEFVKKTLSYLLEAYMREKGIRFYGRGGFTLEEEVKTSGTPDESYCINSNKETPDIVIEIIITSGSINRCDLSKPKRVPEVWFWKSNQIRIFRFNEASSEYDEVSRSAFFPDLDLDLLLYYLAYSDQYDAVNEFIRAIRKE